MERSGLVEAIKEEHTTKELSADEAKEILIKEQQAREKKCSEELEQILKKHNCKLEAVAFLSDGIVRTQVMVKGL